MFLKAVCKIEVDVAVSGQDAIIMCQQRKTAGIDCYRLIVMDINMPGLDGVETTAEIRKIMDNYVKEQQQKHYKIVAHTALPEDQFGNYKKKGFDGFLQKNDNDNLKKFIE